MTFNWNVQGRLMEGEGLKLGFNESVSALEVGGLGGERQGSGMCDLLKSPFCFHSLFSVSYLVIPSSTSQDPNRYAASWLSHLLLYPSVESSLGISYTWEPSSQFSWCLDPCFTLKRQMMRGQHQGSVEVIVVGVGAS